MDTYFRAMKDKVKPSKGPYDSCHIANYLINLAKEKEEAISIMRLLKLVYLSHGWNLANYGRPLLMDPIKAWRYGPVVPAIYYMFRGQDKYNLAQIDCEKPNDIDEESKQLMDNVFEYYKTYNPYQLIALTHEKGSPWWQIYNTQNHDKFIPNDLIKKFYKRKLK